MKHHPTARFEPTSPLLRTVFAAAALVATIATGELIDVLVHGGGTTAPLVVQHSTVVIAQR